jgi:hypothetical protein
MLAADRVKSDRIWQAMSELKLGLITLQFWRATTTVKGIDPGPVERPEVFA